MEEAKRVNSIKFGRVVWGLLHSHIDLSSNGVLTVYRNHFTGELIGETLEGSHGMRHYLYQ